MVPYRNQRLRVHERMKAPGRHWPETGDGLTPVAMTPTGCSPGAPSTRLSTVVSCLWVNALCYLDGIRMSRDVVAEQGGAGGAALSCQPEPRPIRTPRTRPPPETTPFGLSRRAPMGPSWLYLFLE